MATSSPRRTEPRDFARGEWPRANFRETTAADPPTNKPHTHSTPTHNRNTHPQRTLDQRYHAHRTLPQHTATPDDDIMDTHMEDAFPTTHQLQYPRSLTHKRGLKRAREPEAEDTQRSADATVGHQTQVDSPRRVVGMLATIPQSVWAYGSNLFCGFMDLFRNNPLAARQQPMPTPQPTRIDAVSTNSTGNKRRAVHVTPSAFSDRRTRLLAVVKQPPPPTDTMSGALLPPVAPNTPARNMFAAQRDEARRARFHREYFKNQSTSKDVQKTYGKLSQLYKLRAQKAAPNPAPTQEITTHEATTHDASPRDHFTNEPISHGPTTHSPAGSDTFTGGRTTEEASAEDLASSYRDLQISGLISKAHKAQGGSRAQKKAAQLKKEAEEKARQEAEEEEERLLNEKLAEADRLDAEIYAERAAKAAAEKAAEEEAIAEAARIAAQEETKDLIGELPESIREELMELLSGNEDERAQILQLGSIPLQKLTFTRILAGNDGTNSWLDDDAINAWFNSITEAKNRQTGYVKSATNVPEFANLSTAWYDRAIKNGPASLKRWLSRAGVGGTKLLKCSRLFLPINAGAHWTLLIINGEDRSIEYLDSLGGRGDNEFKLARELVKAELSVDYHAQEWVELRRNHSNRQGNMSDCGVFTCLNGLAAAKDMSYKEVTAEKMGLAREMMAGVFVNKGFGGSFEL